MPKPLIKFELNDDGTFIIQGDLKTLSEIATELEKEEAKHA